MFQNTQNTKQQGNVGIGQAIAYFTKQGYTVSLPLNDSQDYDLVVDMNGSLKKIQVKTTSYMRNNKYSVLLKSCGGSSKTVTVTKFDNTKVDFVFATTAAGDNYLIPADQIKSKNTLSLSGDFTKYKLPL